MIADDLFDRLSEPFSGSPITGSGVYLICLKPGSTLGNIEVGERGVLYVGMTEDGLDVRNHFVVQHSGFSSPRRSLAAILRIELGLTAIQRGAGRSRSNFRCYRFPDDQERRLSEWMRRNLLLAQFELEHGVADEERVLIQELQPPLNLKGWGNPRGDAIKALRKICAVEAER